MPAEVIDINANRPHMQGPAICLECKHTWRAVTLLGTCVFDCPECGLAKGVYEGCAIESQEPILHCKCGCWVMIVNQAGIRCVYCGTMQNP